MIVFFLASFLFAVVQADETWKAMDPEQALYVYTRCNEDHILNLSNKTVYMRKWHIWLLEPNDSITHCYTKCVLQGLGIYDEKTKQFMPNRIPIQHKAFKKINEATDDDVAQYRKAMANLAAKYESCKEVFDAYLPVHNKFVDVTRKLYHGTKEGAARIYEAMPDIKRKGESFVKYCEKRAFESQSQGKIERPYKFQLTGSDEQRKSIACIFDGFRYMNGDALNENEIVRDFKLICKGDLEEKVRQVLNRCEKKEAFDYYSCLIRSPFKEDFKNAFNFRELRSANYSYLLLNDYGGPEKIQKELKKLKPIKLN